MAEAQFVTTTGNRALDEELTRLRRRIAQLETSLTTGAQGDYVTRAEFASFLGTLRPSRLNVSTDDDADIPIPTHDLLFAAADGFTVTEDAEGANVGNTVCQEVITARESDTLGAFTTLDERLEAIEALGGSVADYASYSTTTVNATASAAGIDVLYCTNASAVTVNLPTAAGLDAHIFVIKRGSAVSAVTVDPNGSETIDGASTKSLNSQYAVLAVISDGTNWLTLWTFGTVA